MGCISTANGAWMLDLSLFDTDCERSLPECGFARRLQYLDDAHTAPLERQV